MKINQLAAFVQVADVQSLSRAAVAADTAQSLLSRHIALLETTWGRRLFDRTGRGMQLTDFGQRMYPEARRALEQLQQLDMLANEAAGVLSGTVHIGVLPSLSRQLLPLLLRDIQARAPALRLHVTEGFSGSLDEQLASGRLDMIVVNRYGSSALRGEDVLGKLDTYLVGKAGIPALDAQNFAFKDLGNVPLVLPTAPNGLRTTLDLLSRRHAVSLNIVMEVDTGTAMKDVAASGHALTLLPLTAIGSELESGVLGAVKLVSPAIKRTIALSLTRNRPMSEGGRLVASRVGSIATALLRRPSIT